MQAEQQASVVGAMQVEGMLVRDVVRVNTKQPKAPGGFVFRKGAHCKGKAKQRQRRKEACEVHALRMCECRHGKAGCTLSTYHLFLGPKRVDAQNSNETGGKAKRPRARHGRRHTMRKWECGMQQGRAWCVHCASPTSAQDKIAAKMHVFRSV